ncbi:MULTISPECIES: diaminobutyrate acetyltransferase [Tsukamurella]|uniref:L-2,4-diaminobutyric acid acetyltransferase n=1 Tax=Tsukamurella strandjordii TaxID=147577 RepID=A0AA90NIW0_9ACTN|nr:MULTISPECIES: diaminobutyrate acetyltransferase [Tsukamurella]MDP0398804.1 diaminobutyrate acetyltransferase [Tsukamurella strandjordii]GIZ99416.1 L-2,4-diaminobutyric acid acetyltransferase [Tsukamurella sp. TY48]
MSPSHKSNSTATANAGVSTRHPSLDDGVRLWEIARDTAVLDLNSTYAYTLWCRDFADTSIVAEHDGAVAGFVSGYRRPERPDTLFVWQVAVDAAHRGHGIASRMLIDLLDSLAVAGVTRLETTITASNTASQELFGSVAKRRRSTLTVRDLFASHHISPNESDPHEPEQLYTIDPV